MPPIMRPPGSYTSKPSQPIVPDQVLPAQPRDDEIQRLKEENRKLQDLLKAKDKPQVFSVYLQSHVNLDSFRKAISERLQMARHYAASTQKVAHLVIEHGGDSHGPNLARYAAIGVLKDANQLWSRSDANTMGINQWNYSSASIVAVVTPW